MKTESEDHRDPFPLKHRLRLTLSDWKDIGPWLLIGFALIYGIGWTLQGIASSTVGLGPWDISHQQAVVVGVIFSLTVAAQFAFRPSWWQVAFSAAAAFYFGLIFENRVLFPMSVFIPLYLYPSCAYLAFSIFTFCWRSHSRFLRRRIALAWGIAAFFVYAGYFGSTIMPLMPQGLGGFPLDKVTVYAGKNIVSGMMIGSDSDSVIVINGNQRFRVFKHDIQYIVNPAVLKPASSPSLPSKPQMPIRK